MQSDAKNLIASQSYGPTLFPERSIERMSRTVSGTRTEMEKSIEADREGSLGIYVVGCATYFLPSDATARFTSFFQEIIRPGIEKYDIDVGTTYMPPAIKFLGGGIGDTD